MRVVFLVLAFLVSVNLVQAAQINLSPDDSTSLQETIDSAQDGDEIILSEGSFDGDVDLTGKSLSITGQGDSTVIVGSGTVPALKCESGSSKVDNVAITNGSALEGGGVYVLGSCALELTRSTVYGNQASASGSAISVKTSAVSVFANNLIAFNLLSGSGEPHSIYIKDSSPRFIRNTIASNITPGNAFFIIGSKSRPRIIRNIIANNGDPDRGVGRGMCVLQGARLGRVRVQRNVFFDNVLSSIFINGTDFDGQSGLRRAQRQVGSRRFSRNKSFDPLFVTLGADIANSDFGLQESSKALNQGAFSGKNPHL